MSEQIQVPQLGTELDMTLKAFADAENTDNNGLILYIRRGEIAFDTYENLFTITPLT